MESNEPLSLTMRDAVSWRRLTFQPGEFQDVGEALIAAGFDVKVGPYAARFDTSPCCCENARHFPDVPVESDGDKGHPYQQSAEATVDHAAFGPVCLRCAATCLASM
jgi:hypothetical protein